MEKKQNQTNQKKKKNQSKSNSPGAYITIAAQMFIIIFIGVFGGTQLDSLIKMEFPVFTVLLSIVSVALAIYIAIKNLLKIH